MSKQAKVEPYTVVIPLADAGPDVFVNKDPPWIPGEGIRSIFGGFLLAHSVSAAQETVGAAFDVHSLQSAFLLPGNAREKIVYVVDRVADGRSFVTRLVRATQGGACLYVATIGFQKSSPALALPQMGGVVLDYHAAMPNLGGINPDDSSLSPGPVVLMEMGLPKYLTEANTPLPDPFEWRFLPREQATRPAGYRLRAFVRSERLSTGSRATHLSALAFLTDEWLIFTCNLANPGFFPNGMGSVAIEATVNHSVWFHSPTVRADDWMLCERNTSWGAGGRILIHQRMWNFSDGRMVLSCVQEGTLRLKNANL